MPLGRLLAQVAAVLIALAIIAGAYALYRESKVSDFQRTLTFSNDVISMPLFLTLFDTAPDVICSRVTADFGQSSTLALYHTKQLTRIDHLDNASKASVHQIISTDGMHIWSDTSDEITFIPRERLVSLPATIVRQLQPALDSVECNVWWMPDEETFNVPSSLPIVQYRS